MKKHLSLILIIFCLLTAFSQTGQSSGIEVDTPHRGLSSYDMKQFHRPKAVTSTFLESMNSPALNELTARDAQLEVEPYAQIDVNRWGVIKNIDTNGEVLYSSERVGNDFNVVTYNDDIEMVENFSIEIPANANQAEVLNHYSTNFFSNDGLGEFMIYLHYFDPEIEGPEGQIWEIWVVNSNGDILQELTGYFAVAKVDEEGNHKLYTYFDEDDEVIIKSIDVTTWEVADTYTFDSELINFFMGSSFDFITIEGEEFIVIAHYESLFMDNTTLEVFPDNSLIVKLLDFDFNEVKTMSLNIDSRFPEAGEFTIPQAQFGMFYRDRTYDISKNIFNDDNKLEIVYGIYYYDMMADNEWNSYIVANEDGEILHELNEYVIDNFTEMNSIDGFDNQVGLLMGEGGMANELGFFNIESWSFDHIFDAVTDGDQLSDKFNRIPAEDSFHYVIGLGQPDEGIEGVFGVIGEYQRDGTMFERHQFLLPNDVVLFTPILTRYALIPNLFMENNEVYFMYIYKEMHENGSIFNNLVISNQISNPLVEFRGDTSQGNIIGSTFLTDGNGNFNKMTIEYEFAYDDIRTDFYRLPFTGNLSVSDPLFSEFSFYPNPSDGLVHIKAAKVAKEIQVYGVTGKLILNKSLSNSQESINLSFLAKGIYFANIKFADGTSKKVKFIKK